jgi:hypothetical protein
VVVVWEPAGIESPISLWEGGGSGSGSLDQLWEVKVVVVWELKIPRHGFLV